MHVISFQSFTLLSMISIQNILINAPFLLQNKKTAKPVKNGRDCQLGQALFYAMATQESISSHGIPPKGPAILTIFMAEGQVCTYLFLIKSPCNYAPHGLFLPEYFLPM